MNPILSTEYGHFEYDYFPENDPPPAYDCMLEPPQYGYRAVFGISHELDELITGRTPYCYLNSCEKIYRLTHKARRHKSKLMTSSSTREAIGNIFYSHQSQRVVGFISLPAAIAHDIIQPPYHFTRMAIALSQSKYERKKVENEVLDEILESLSLSLKAVLRMVVRLGLETYETVERQIQERGYYLYLTLARLLEAYGSRFAPLGTVYLSSKKRLPKEHCSGIARVHFDQIHSLKDSVIFADLFPAYSLPDASAVIERWFRRALPALKESSMDRNEDYHFSHVLQRLRNIQDELQGLLLLVPEE